MENKNQISGASAPPLPPPYYASYVPRNKRPEYYEFKSRVSSSKGLAISILSILLSILFLETIFFQSPGIAAPIYLAAFYCSIYYFFRDNAAPLNKVAVILTIPAMLMAVSFFTHYNPSTRWITWLTLIGIICVQLILLGNFQIISLFSPDTFVKVISNLFAKPFTNIPMPFHSFGTLKNKKSATTKNLLYAAIGIAVAIPVTAILMSLFVQADAVFAASVKSFKNFIGLDIDRMATELFLGIPAGIFLGAALLGLKYEKHTEKPVKDLGSCIEPVITGTFLTIINIFLIAFVGFQFMYLFGGLDNIKTSGISYAEYARRGFFELCTASAIIFAIALFVIVMTKKKNEKLSIWVSLGTVILCAGDGVLLISAVKRMFIYISAYGLSIKRVLTLWLMAVIGFCLLWMIIKCFKIKLDVTKWIGMTVIVGVCILSLTNIEKIIAQYNVDSYLKNPDEPSVVLYLNHLSYTAAPQLEKLQDLTPQQKTEISFSDLVQKKKHQLSARNKLYGFTLDSIEASKVLSKY